MAYSLKNEILNKIGMVYEMAENCKLENEFFELVDAELTFLADYFRVSKTQSFFLSIILTKNCSGLKVDFEDLNNYFDSIPIKIIEFVDDFDDLYERRLLKKKKLHRKSEFIRNFNEEYYMNELVLNKILNGEPLPETLKEDLKFDNIYSLLQHLYEMIDKRDDDETTTKEMFENAKMILNDNTHLPLIEKVKCFAASNEDKYLFLYVVWKFIDGNKDLWVEKVFKEIYSKSEIQFIQIQRFISKENALVKEEWLEVEEAVFYDDVKMKLTEKSFELLTECDLKLFNKHGNSKKNDSIILPDNIPFRELIYSSKEVQQLDLLKNLLLEENFKNTQDRLLEKALPKGITVLLHGAPGTCKTESVLQIAKATHREIMKVDISASRSMWFGESEKIIKRVFKEYKSLMAIRSAVPILFFNEADAIISARKEGVNSNISDTENRIQNILLEEIENFEGILIATTNLSKNYDKAFERRFLFKIEFQKPILKAKTQIWKSKMPHLSMEDIEILSTQFDFSGGQIDNVVRKNEINEIIYGSKMDLQTIIDSCKEETLNGQNSRNPIGFNSL